MQQRGTNKRRATGRPPNSAMPLTSCVQTDSLSGVGKPSVSGSAGGMAALLLLRRDGELLGRGDAVGDLAGIGTERRRLGGRQIFRQIVGRAAWRVQHQY